MSENKAQNDKYNQMMFTPIPKLIMALSISTITNQMVSTVYNMVDTFFVAQLGTYVTAAVGIVNSLQSFIWAFGFGIAMGVGALIARNLGRKDLEKCNQLIVSALAMAVAFGLAIISIVLPCVKPIMKMLGASESVLPYAIAYGRIIAIAAPVMCLSGVCQCSIRYAGFLKMSLVGSVVGCILNGCMDPILIFVLDLGVAGAALSTLIAECVSFSISFSFLIRNKTSLRLSIKNISKDPKDYLAILHSGVPTIFRQMMGSVSSALLNNFAKPFGDSAVAAVTVSNKIYTLCRNFVLGVGQALQPVVGFCYGAGDRKRVKKAFYFAVGYGAAICVALACFLMLKTELVVSLFSKNDPEVLRYGMIGLRYCCYVLPLLSFSTLVNQVFQVMGFAKSASILASCRQGICFAPAIIILPKIFGVNGVLASQSASDLMTALISLPFWLWMNNYLKTSHQDIEK